MKRKPKELGMVTHFTQCHVSNAVRFFGAPFMKRHGLVPYRDPDTPTFFYGCYSQNDYDLLGKIRAPVIVSWCGADAKRINPKRVKFFRSRPRIKHLVKSRFLQADLERTGLPHRRINLHGTDLDDLSLTPLGSNVYVYLPENRVRMFGPLTLASVQRALPGVKFVKVKSHLRYSRAQLIGIYKSAAIGLRLTKHDGCANTVLEMGMMGRYCVHNGDSPNAIPWSTVKDVVAAINGQLAKSGRVHRSLPPKMREFLAVPSGWLTVGFWSDHAAAA